MGGKENKPQTIPLGKAIDALRGYGRGCSIYIETAVKLLLQIADEELKKE